MGGGEGAYPIVENSDSGHGGTLADDPSQDAPVNGYHFTYRTKYYNERRKTQIWSCFSIGNELRTTPNVYWFLGEPDTCAA